MLINMLSRYFLNSVKPTSFLGRFSKMITQELNPNYIIPMNKNVPLLRYDYSSILKQNPSDFGKIATLSFPRHQISNTLMHNSLLFSNQKRYISFGDRYSGNKDNKNKNDNDDDFDRLEEIINIGCGVASLLTTVYFVRENRHNTGALIFTALLGPPGFYAFYLIMSPIIIAVTPFVIVLLIIDTAK